MLLDLVTTLEANGVRGNAAQLLGGIAIDPFHGRKAVHGLEAAGAVCMPDAKGERWFLRDCLASCVRVEYQAGTVLFAVELN